MGIYDRDYYRQPQSGLNVRAPRTIIGWIILINVAVFLLDGLTAGPAVRTPLGIAQSHPLGDLLAVRIGDLVQPWYWWRFLTYGFTHAPWPHWGHIFGNMLGLFFLGPAVEQLYGRREFLRLYLTLIVVAGIVWAATNYLQGLLFGGVPWGGTAVGASGAVVGVVILFALNFPRQTLLLFFVLPVPAWVVGVIVVLFDLAEALQPGSSHIAYQAHMAGAAFAFLYWRNRWSLTRLTDRIASRDWLKRRPKLRVHHPDDAGDQARGSDLGREVDRILEKIHREGEAALTRKERQTLETASRRYQKRRRDSS